MAEYASLPAKLNGSPIADLADVNVTAARTVNQNATTDGVRTTYGIPKHQAQVTFKNFANKAAFLRAVGANDIEPPPFNLQYILGADPFTLERCVVSTYSAQSDQDGTANLQLTIMAEDHIDENAA